jgi:hypothetical protein
MKKTIIATIGLALTWGLAHAEPAKSGTELAGSGVYYYTGDDTAYDSGIGVDLQTRFWFNPYLGCALGLGAASWEVNAMEIAESYDGFSVGVTVEGSVTHFPLGGAILFRPVDSRALALTLEAGVRYVVIDSHAEAAVTVADPFGNRLYLRDTIEFDDVVVGLIGVNIESKVNDELSLLAGFGYQFDLDKGHAEWMGRDLGENELKAFLFKLGLVLRL